MEKSVGCLLTISLSSILKLVHLIYKPDLLLNGDPQLTDLDHVAQILPGTLLNGTVSVASSTGVVLRLFGSVEGSVDYYHLNLRCGLPPPRIGSTVGVIYTHLDVLLMIDI
jgi:hypothetical protein